MRSKHCCHCHDHDIKNEEQLESVTSYPSTRMNVLQNCLMCNDITDNIYNSAPICKSCEHKFYNELKYANPDKINSIKKLSDGVDSILQGLKDLYGIDPDNCNFKDTKYRVARGLMEMNYGTNIKAAEDLLHISFDSNNDYNGLITCNNIKVFSCCPHHLLPVQYRIDLAYVPSNGRCLGLSKLPRLAKTLAKSMLLQEDYTNKMVEILESTTKCAGCGIRVKGIHNCVQCRGVGMPDVTTTTIALRGIMMANSSLKEEWLNQLD